MGVKTRYGVDLSAEGKEFWKELISLEAFIGVVISPIKAANSQSELFRLVHFIYWIAPEPNVSFPDGVRFLRSQVSLLPRNKRRSLQRAARDKIQGLNRVQIRSVLYGRDEISGPKQSFYKSWEWRTLRMKILKDRGRRCECCGATPEHHDVHGVPIRLCVDHIRPVSTHWDQRLDPGNLQILCDECNQGKGAWDETDWRGDAAIKPSTPHTT